MGYFDLSRYPALECEKKYALLSIVCQGRKQIFLDSDRDGDFSDEEALGIYEFDRSYAELLTDTGALNVVCTKIAANGAEVALSGDFIGHGTFIASLVGGECTAYRGWRVTAAHDLSNICAGRPHGAEIFGYGAG